MSSSIMSLSSFISSIRDKFYVPTPEKASDNRFLRNDNTWQTVTPDNIGAPTKDGAGATGTWGINISGKADTAGTADTANAVTWSGVTSKPDGMVKVSSWDGSTLKLTTSE